MGSPWPGASILMTSAPMSPSSCPQKGPAINVPSSSTRRSARAPVGAAWVCFMAGGVVPVTPVRVKRGHATPGITIHVMDSHAVEIVEVGPRDGLQSESQVLPTPAKVEFVRRLERAGLRSIEVASFVNPKRVPQMADAEGVLAALAPVPGARYIGLILNRKGFDRARAAGCTEVGMEIAASESFSQRNQGCSVDEGVGTWLEIA